MRKVILFLLSSMVLSVPIVGMEHKEQELTLILLPPEMLYKITPHCDLQSIGRLRQVCKQFNNECDAVKVICPFHRLFEHPCQFIQHPKIQKTTYAVCELLFDSAITRGDYYMTYQLGLLLQEKRKEMVQKQQECNDNWAEYYRLKETSERRIAEQSDREFFIGTGFVVSVIGSFFLLRRYFY
jgi:F-box associated protein